MKKSEAPHSGYKLNERIINDDDEEDAKIVESPSFVVRLPTELVDAICRSMDIQSLGRFFCVAKSASSFNSRRLFDFLLKRDFNEQLPPDHPTTSRARYKYLNSWGLIDFKKIEANDVPFVF
jgi:hypothetical protein